MRHLNFLSVMGIALGFISGTQNPVKAGTYVDRSIDRGEASRDNEHQMRLTTRAADVHPFSFTSESKVQEPSIERAMATSLLERVGQPSDPDFDHTVLGHPRGRSQSDADEGPSQAHVSATPLPAALPLFAGGLGVLGFFARRRKKKASNSPRV